MVTSPIKKSLIPFSTHDENQNDHTGDLVEFIGLFLCKDACSRHESLKDISERQ
jgi:hypothetical protein